MDSIPDINHMIDTGDIENLPVYTREEAAAYCDIAERTITNYQKLEEGHPRRFPEGTKRGPARLWSRAELDQYNQRNLKPGYPRLDEGSDRVTPRRYIEGDYTARRVVSDDGSRVVSMTPDAESAYHYRVTLEAPDGKVRTERVSASKLFKVITQ